MEKWIKVASILSQHLDGCEITGIDPAPSLFHRSVAETLESLLTQASKAWPEIEVDPERFVVHLAGLMRQDDIISSLNQLIIEDLYLAFACLTGDERALFIFEELYIPLIRRNLRKLNISSSAMDDIVQRFRYRLLVRLPTREPVLSKYNGSAKLGSWLRVIAIRQAMDFVKARDQNDLPLNDGALADHVIECDQEIILIKGKYHHEFEKALKEALQNLGMKQRNLLRASILDRMSVDEIGNLYNVHRATSARWLVNIRTQLKETIKKLLESRLNLHSDEFDRIAPVLISQLNMSLSRILNMSQ